MNLMKTYFKRQDIKKNWLISSFIVEMIQKIN